MDTTFTHRPDGGFTVTVQHPNAWPRRGSTLAARIRETAMNAMSKLGRPIPADDVRQMASGPDTTVFDYTPSIVTYQHVGELYGRWQQLGRFGGDLDTYLAEHLRGRLIDTPHGPGLVFCVINAGFAGHAIHARTLDTGQHVIAAHIR